MSDRNRQLIKAFNLLHKTKKKGKDAHANASAARLSADTKAKILGVKK